MALLSMSYTFILKDELLPKNPDNGREQSTVSWEYNFSVDFKFDSCESTRSVYIPFKDLRPTYRGKEKKDAKHLNLKSIKRFSIMMRSFFATQDGPFTLSIKSISAVKASLAEGLPTDVEESTRHTSKEKDNAKEFHGRLLGPGKASPWWNIVISIVIAGGILYAAYRASPILFSRL
ncbi:MAG: hypothetical protein M1820_000621 [Bogoriella megaspora]|nr:MAG: hypothetical protein M1820_000621 [Bogoriella megaspora]